MSEIWTPHLTVAAVIERHGRFLMVEEDSEGQRVFNQPAGHVEDAEALTDAVRRETMEETRHRFTPQAICGIYRWRNPLNQATYLRVAYCGEYADPLDKEALDQDIIACHWLSREELMLRHAQLRSPLVLRCIDDYLAGQRLPLDIIAEIV